MSATPNPSANPSGYPWRRALLALLLIASSGALRMPFEQAMEQEFRRDGFRDWSPNISARDELTQASFVGALGGFRSLVANVYDLRAHVARGEKDWDKVESFRGVTTTLQPRFWKHWDMAAWDMAWNAYAYFRGEAEEHRDDIEGWRFEKVVMPRYLEKGIEFARRGTEWLPETYRLPRVVADIYAQKYDDRCTAAEWYLQASQTPDAPTYVYRAYAHSLALCEGSEEEAYAVTAALYRGDGRLTPTLRYDMENLEDFFARRAAAAGTRAQLQAATRAEGAGYREQAALAIYYLEVEDDLAAATAAYVELARDPRAPAFYLRKWAFLLARNPARAAAAHKALKALFLGDQEAFREDDLKAFAELEKKLAIPEADRVAGG